MRAPHIILFNCDSYMSLDNTEPSFYQSDYCKERIENAALRETISKMTAEQAAMKEVVNKAKIVIDTNNAAENGEGFSGVPPYAGKIARDALARVLMIYDTYKAETGGG